MIFANKGSKCSRQVLLHVSLSGLQRVLHTNGFSGRLSLRAFRPHSVKHFGFLRRSGVIGAHSGICRLRMNPSGNAAVSSWLVAWWCGHFRSSRSDPAQVRRAVAATRYRYDTAIFSTGVSSIYTDGVPRLEHAYSPLLNCALRSVNALDGEGRLIHALSDKVHRKRQAETRFARATSVLSLLIPKIRKPAVRC